MEERKPFEKNCGCRHNNGIKCDVKNCYYHDCDTYCTAEQISVGPHDAASSTETTCVTFRPKAD